MRRPKKDVKRMAGKKSGKMAIRVGVAVVGSALSAWILTAAPAWGTGLLLTVLTALMGFELTVPTGLVHARLLQVCAVLGAAAMPWIFYFHLPLAVCALLLFGAAALLFLIAILQAHGPSPAELAVTLAAAVLFPAALSLMLETLRMENGRKLVVIPLIAAWCADGLALITGMLIGKHKLIPRVSPNKTVEGFFGGIGGSLIGLAVYGGILTLRGFHVPWPAFAVYAVVGALAGVLGDLSLSYIKRACGIKDFGKLLPEHGGVLDRFDSVSFAVPACYFCFLLFPPTF